ncbi:hypothetical protein E2C01_008583 [Portunus trituberculatus]|uniref:Uncharacterized protein n=1 Tax=Portunus trituberculatus TaxID=210409 RepID=A0A5B7D2C7_PORTR|nr:hypothetical protein [Portunus trituberculatus]
MRYVAAPLAARVSWESRPLPARLPACPPDATSRKGSGNANRRGVSLRVTGAGPATARTNNLPEDLTASVISPTPLTLHLGFPQVPTYLTSQFITIYSGNAM